MEGSMAYYGRTKNEGLIGLIYCIVIGYWIYSFFGWIGLAIVLTGMFGIIFVMTVISAILVRKKERSRANAPCEHGLPGALYEYKQCPLCEQDKIAREQRAKKLAEEEEAQKKAAKERAYKEWVAKIRLPEYLINMHPAEFEHLICDLFQRMGYEVEHTQYSGDGGIDGYLRKNGDLSILQCKRVKGSVGEPVLRDLFGTMHDKDAKEGIVATTGNVSAKARAWAENKPIKILELDEIAGYIRTYYREDDVVPESFIPDKEKKDFCPKCGNPMRVVNWRGKSFMGCTAYPSCHYSTSLMGKMKNKKVSNKSIQRMLKRGENSPI